MSKFFFTSDTHFDHQLVAELRGFTSPAEHDAAVVEEWNRVVGKNDTVWHLGDVGMGPLRRWASSVRALNGTIHLVTGNHDDAAPGVSRKAQKVQRAWMELFESIQPFARIRRGGDHALLSHYPYSGEGVRNLDDRFVQYRLRNTGLPLVHGHTHDKDQRLSFDEGTPMLHVGWDAWKRLVTLEEVWDTLLANGAGPAPHE